MTIDRGPGFYQPPRPRPQPGPVKERTFEDLEAEAAQQLHDSGAPVLRLPGGKVDPTAIIRIEPGFILFRSKLGSAFTAWKRTIGGKVHVRWQRGWPLEPHEHIEGIFDLLERQEGDSGKGSE